MAKGRIVHIPVWTEKKMEKVSVCVGCKYCSASQSLQGR